MQYTYNSDEYLEVRNGSGEKKALDEFLNTKVFWAFSNKQFKEGMKKIGATDEGDLYSMDGGGYYKKTDAAELHRLFQEYNDGLDTYLKDPANFFNACVYELFNHEYIYNIDAPEEFLDMNCLTYDQLTDGQKDAFEQAKKYAWKEQMLLESGPAK